VDPKDKHPDPKKRKKISVLDAEGLPIRKRQCLSDCNDNALAGAIERAGPGPGLVPPKEVYDCDLKEVPACDLLHALKGALGLTAR
jgi:hypothetical protein